MIAALLFAVIIISSSVITVFYKSFTGLNPDKSNYMLMLVAATAPPAVLYAAVCGFSGFEFELSTVVTALAGAALNIITICTFLKAMSGGSFTLAVIIINLNFCIPILLSVIFLKERASALQLVGIAVLVAVILIMNASGKGDKQPQNNEASEGEAANSQTGADEAEKQKAASVKKNLLFLGLATLACLGNGVLNFVIKLQQHYTPHRGENTFYFIMYGSACVVCSVGYVIARLTQKKAAAVRGKKSILLGLCVGACTVASQYPQTFLARYVSAAVEFTVIAAAAVLLSIAIGFVKYKEKPTVKNICSALCCLAAIFLQVLT